MKQMTKRHIAGHPPDSTSPVFYIQVVKHIWWKADRGKIGAHPDLQSAPQELEGDESRVVVHNTRTNPPIQFQKTRSWPSEPWERWNNFELQRGDEFVVRVRDSPDFGAPGFQGPLFLGRLPRGEWGRFIVNGRTSSYEGDWAYHWTCFAFHNGQPKPTFYDAAPVFDVQRIRTLRGMPAI